MVSSSGGKWCFTITSPDWIFFKFWTSEHQYISYLLDATREKLFCDFSLFEVGRVKIETTFPFSDLGSVAVFALWNILKLLRVGAIECPPFFKSHLPFFYSKQVKSTQIKLKIGSELVHTIITLCIKSHGCLYCQHTVCRFEKKVFLKSFPQIHSYLTQLPVFFSY